MGGKLKYVWYMYFNCCCLYSSVYREEADVCRILLVVVARLRCSVLSRCAHCVGLIGRSHRSVVGYRPLTSASLPL